MTQGVVARQYSLTDLGKEVLPTVERFDRRVMRALSNYKSQMTELADKYGIPEDKRNQFMAAMLSPWAAQLYGFSDEVQQRIQSIEKAHEDSQARLQGIEQKAREFLK